MDSSMTAQINQVPRCIVNHTSMEDLLEQTKKPKGIKEDDCDWWRIPLSLTKLKMQKEKENIR